MHMGFGGCPIFVAAFEVPSCFSAERMPSSDNGLVWSLYYAEPTRVVPLGLSCAFRLGPIPAELGGLTALKTLFLDENQLSGERF